MNALQKEEVRNLRTYIVDQRIIIEQLKDYIKDLEQSLLMRKATLLKEMAPPG